MNGIVALIICFGLLFAGLEQGRSGVVVKFFLVAALVNAELTLPARLAAATAEAEAAIAALAP